MTTNKGGDPREELQVYNFDGRSKDPLTYLSWEKKMDEYFEYYDLSTEERFLFASCSLKKRTHTWFKDVQDQLVRGGEKKVDTWKELKRYMRMCFPSKVKEVTPKVAPMAMKEVQVQPCHVKVQEEPKEQSFDSICYKEILEDLSTLVLAWSLSLMMQHF